MINLRHIPLLKLVVPMAIGTLLGIHLNVLFSVLCYTILIACILLLGSIKRNKWSQRQLNASLFMVIWMVLGTLNAGLHSRQQRIQTRSIDTSPKYWLCTVLSHPEWGRNSKHVEVQCAVPGQEEPVRAIMYYPIENNEIHKKSVLWVRARPEAFASAETPFHFNAKVYYKRKGIGYRMYVADQNYLLVNSGDQSLGLIEKVKRKVLQCYDKFIKDESVKGLVNALTVGERSGLGQEEKQRFSNTGTVHVLAVSGLHVGLIFIILRTLFSLLGKWMGWLKVGLMLAGLWSYVLIAGASSSVIRAGIMFSAMMIGQHLEKKGNSYNALCLAAWLILAWDPFQLLELGFQLSFLAVWGIVFFQPKIQSLYHPENRVVRVLWSLTTVSIAAQLSTTPLTLYYFHQFPVYFIPANLLVVPYVTVILIASLILIPVGLMLPELAGAVGFIIESYTNFILWVTERLGQLPGAVWQGIHLSNIQLMLLYLFILILAIALQLRSLRHLNALMVIWVLVLLLDSRSPVELYSTEHALYQVKGKELMIYSDIKTIQSSAFLQYTYPSLLQYTNPETVRVQLKKVAP